MGKLIYSDLAHYTGLTTGAFELIGGLFGLFYRISMFADVTKAFDPLVNPINILAIICIVFGVIILMIEGPIPPFRNTFITTSFTLKAVIYFVFGCISIFNYQNVNPALFMFFQTWIYLIANSNGEGKTTSTGNMGKV